MENKQTAVEWLENKLSKLYDTQFKTFEEFRSKEAILWQQAKAIEKEQMIKFADKVIYNAECSFTGTAYLEKDINEIYNETYDN